MRITNAGLVAILFPLILAGFHPRASAQKACQGARDTAVTGSMVATLIDFETTAREEGMRAGVESAAIELILSDFRRLHDGRVLPVAEQHMALLDLLFQNSVPYARAQSFMAGFRRNVHCPVNIGFLQRVRTVDLGDQPVLKIGEKGVQPPRPQFQPLPLYTETARQFRIEGLILLNCIILEDGTVANCRCTRTLGYGLDESAVLTVQEKWRFEPGTLDGVPVRVQANVEVTFRLY
jgi:TonB family protein